VTSRWFQWVIVLSLTLLPTMLWGQAVGGESSSSAAGGEAASRPSGSFLVFDEIKLKGKPDLAAYGLRPITVLYHTNLWGPNEPDDRPDMERVRTLAMQAWRRGHLVCIDIEHWPLYDVPDGERQVSIDKLVTVADAMHAAAPGLRIGYYSLLPRRDYWAPVGKDRSKEVAWKKHNVKMRELAERVDVVFPSLYTFYEDREGWVKYAEANIAEARKYGKQVYVFLWPWYHHSSKDTPGKMIPADYWRLQLDTCRRLADGVVIWTDPYKQWDPEALWWEQTRQFIAELEVEE
jgi:hypothetical protein